MNLLFSHDSKRLEQALRPMCMNSHYRSDFDNSITKILRIVLLNVNSFREDICNVLSFYRFFEHGYLSKVIVAMLDHTFNIATITTIFCLDKATF